MIESNLEIRPPTDEVEPGPDAAAKSRKRRFNPSVLGYLGKRLGT